MLSCRINPTSRKRPKIKPSQKCLSLLGLIFGLFRLVRFKPTTQHRIKNLFAQNCSAYSQLPGDTPLPLGIRRVNLKIDLSTRICFQRSNWEKALALARREDVTIHALSLGTKARRNEYSGR